MEALVVLNPVVAVQIVPVEFDEGRLCLAGPGCV